MMVGAIAFFIYASRVSRDDEREQNPGITVAGASVPVCFGVAVGIFTSSVKIEIYQI